MYRSTLNVFNGTVGSVGPFPLLDLGVPTKQGYPKWMENPIKKDDLGVPLFSETSI